MSAVFELEDDIKQLPLQEQLWLMERLAHYIREQASSQINQGVEHNPMANGHQQQELRKAVVDNVQHPQAGSPLDSIPIEWTNKTLLIETMDRLLQKLGITGEPIGAISARELIQQEANLGPNELSQGIIEMREERLRDRGLF